MDVLLLLLLPLFEELSRIVSDEDIISDDGIISVASEIIRPHKHLFARTKLFCMLVDALSASHVSPVVEIERMKKLYTEFSTFFVEQEGVIDQSVFPGFEKLRDGALECESVYQALLNAFVLWSDSMIERLDGMTSECAWAIALREDQGIVSKEVHQTKRFYQWFVGHVTRLEQWKEFNKVFDRSALNSIEWRLQALNDQV